MCVLPLLWIVASAPSTAASLDPLLALNARPPSAVARGFDTEWYPSGMGSPGFQSSMRSGL